MASKSSDGVCTSKDVEGHTKYVSTQASISGPKSQEELTDLENEAGISGPKSQEELTGLENEGGPVLESGSGHQVTEKTTFLMREHTYLHVLRSQLEEQELFFQEQIAQTEKKAAEQVRSAEEGLKKVLNERKKLEWKLSESQKEKKNLDKEHARMVTTFGELDIRFIEKQQENKSVKENIEFSKEEFKKMEQKRLQETAQRQKVRALSEQVAGAKRRLIPRELREQEMQGGQIAPRKK